MNKFERICTGGPFGDETCSYVIDLFDKEITVEDFIKMVMCQYPNEWGHITCGSVSLVHYNRGSIRFDSGYEDLKERKVASVSAHGGWSLMDYNIVIHKQKKSPISYDINRKTPFRF